MGTVTLTAEADVTVRRDSALAAGLGDHLPVGYWSGAIYRSAIRFPIPAGWTDWSAITSATLNIYVTDHAHVGVRNSQFYVRRYGGTLWTKAAGTQDCESGYSAGNNTQSDDIGINSTDQVSTNSGSTVNTKRAVGVTGLVRWYWDNAQAKIVLILDPVSSADYMEFWSREHGSYAPTLVIDYEDASPPLAPTLLTPAANAIVDETKPTFTWDHRPTQSNPQINAKVQLFDMAGTQIGLPVTVVGAAETLTWATDLTRGQSYRWSVATEDVDGYGPYAEGPPYRVFTVRGVPVVTIDATRRMEFAVGTAPVALVGAPRLRVNWTADQTQTHYRVQTAAGFDSGWLPGVINTYLLTGVDLTDNVAVNVTVSSRSAPGIEGSASRSFTPRYGLTTHRKDLGSIPQAWASEPAITSVVPVGATLQMEYGSAAIANASPTGGWFASLSAVAKRQFLYWRAWFIPSATAGPTLDKVVITTNNSVALVDKWYSDLAATAIAPPWSIATDEYVYGTRSISAVCDGTERYVYSARVKVRANRTYILTGLMKAQNNPGSKISLIDPAISNVVTRIFTETPVLAATQDWYDPERNETLRYRSPVWVAPADMDVVVALTVKGTAGSQAWFEAVKLEESTVATPWSPGAVGATVVDAGGVQVDGSKGGVFRYKGTDGGLRSVVAGGTKGLLFAGDTELESPADGSLAIDGVPISLNTHTHAPPVVPGVQSGVVNVSGTTQSGTTAVVFPRSYVSTPNVVAVQAAGALTHFCVVSGITTSGFNVLLVHRDGTASTFGPMAVQWMANGTLA